MKYYVRLILNVGFLVVVLGLIAPALISANDTLLVLGGVLSIISVPVVLYYGNRTFVKSIWDKLNETNS